MTRVHEYPVTAQDYIENFGVTEDMFSYDHAPMIAVVEDRKRLFSYINTEDQITHVRVLMHATGIELATLDCGKGRHNLMVGHNDFPKWCYMSFSAWGQRTDFAHMPVSGDCILKSEVKIKVSDIVRIKYVRDIALMMRHERWEVVTSTGLEYHIYRRKN